MTVSGGAGSPQLKLQVALDLTFLRSQLSGLGRTVGDVPFSVVPTLDLRQLKRDINRLQKDIVININDAQIGTLNTKLVKAKEKLDLLRGEKIVVSVTGEASVTQREARRIRAGVKRGVLSQGGKILLPVGLQPIADSVVDQFKADLQRRLGTVSVGVKANLEATAVRGGARSRADIDAEVARGLQAISEIGAARMAGVSGGVTEEARRTQLRSAIEDLTVKQLQQVAKQLEVGGVSRLRKADLINKIVADASMEMIKRYLDPQAVMRGGGKGELQRFLDTFARGVFRMLGIDPESLRQRRLPPAIDWPAERPQRRIPIGPSATGRALPPGATPLQLPGTAFASQRRLVGNVLTPELKEILRQAANAFVDSVRRELNAAVRAVRVRDLGTTVRAALTGQRIAGLLPPAVGRTPNIYSSGTLGGETRAELFARREREARIRSAARGAMVMEPGLALPPARDPLAGQVFRAPSVPRAAAAPIPPGAARSATDFGQALRGIEGMLLRSRVPLSGAIEEVGKQFGFAIKQVLLFGTTYKALAFFIDLPRQAFEATKNLQLFNNQIRAITDGPEEASRSVAFLNDIVDRLSLPLQNARDGFVQLYASLSPAGIPTAEIEGLFEAISSGAAALTLSGAEMDRMILALSQMAAKGNIAAEEVRQLANVLPGAVPMLAEAARMDMDQFVTAMRRGQLSGEALRNTLFNFSILLKRDFSEGAEGAAKTLQGAMNQIGTAVQRMYEQFAPVIEQLATSVLPGLIRRIEDAGSGVAAFAKSFTDANAPLGELSGTAKTVFDVLRLGQQTIEAIVLVARSLAPTFSLFGQTLFIVLEAARRVISTPLGRFLAQVAVQAALVNTALVLLAKVGLIGGMANIARYVTALVKLRRKMLLVKLTTKGLLIALGKFALPAAIIAGILSIRDAFGGLNQQLAEMSVRARRTKDDLMDLASAGAVAPVTERLVQAQTRAQSLEQSRTLLQSLAEGGPQRMSEEEFARLKRSGLAVGLARGPGGIVQRGIGDVPLIGAGADRTQEQARANLQSAEVGWREALSEWGNAETALRTAVQVANRRQGEGLRDVDPVLPEDAAAAGKALRDFVESRVRLIQMLGQIEENHINLMTGLTREQATVESARLRHLTETAANERQLFEAQREAVNYSAETRDAYLRHIQEVFLAEQRLIDQRRDEALFGPLIQMERDLNAQMEEAEALTMAAVKGRSSLNAVEQAALQIARQRRGLGTNWTEQHEARARAVMQEAKAVDALNEANRRRIFRAELDNRLELANILDPEARRRRELEQQGFTEEEVRLERQVQQAEELQARLEGIANSIGDAFGTAFSDIITGASSVQEALANAFRSIASSFANMVGEMISQWMKGQVIGLFNFLLPGLGGAAAGAAASGGLGNFASAFGGGGPAFNPGAFSMAPIIPFAKGGIVTGPTLGLVGEGRFNEAVVPLPDGRSIPVDLGGTSGAGGDISTSIVVNVSNGQASSEVSGSQGNQLARELEGAVRQVILKETRPGGIIFSQR